MFLFPDGWLFTPEEVCCFSLGHETFITFVDAGSPAPPSTFPSVRDLLKSKISKSPFIELQEFGFNNETAPLCNSKGPLFKTSGLDNGPFDKICSLSLFWDFTSLPLDWLQSELDTDWSEKSLFSTGCTDAVGFSGFEELSLFTLSTELPRSNCFFVKNWAMLVWRETTDFNHWK